MKYITSTSDRPHTEILKDYLHLYNDGDQVEITNWYGKKILTVSK